MRVIFSHGKESGPWGSKIKQMATVAEQLGCNVHSVDYSDLSDPDRRAARLVSVIRQQQQPPVLVGSSMGGYVSLVAAEECPVRGLFLLAPALYMPGYTAQAYPVVANTEIVHGWSDEVISFENSLNYARVAQCALHLLDGDHRLNRALPAILPLFEGFLRRL